LGVRHRREGKQNDESAGNGALRREKGGWGSFGPGPDVRDCAGRVRGADGETIPPS
jgi:hypothetical protein